MPSLRSGVWLTLGCIVMAAVFGGSLGCGKTANGFEELSAEICAPEGGPFTLEIDNEFLPFPVGRVLKLQGDEEGTTVGLIVTVTNQTEMVAGVTTRVVTETHTEDGELVETSRNFFVQAPDGTVCYYGEEVNNIQDGVVVNHDGSWKAGEGGNLPGIIMPGAPRLNTEFAQEGAPGVAEDRSAIVGLGESRTVPAGNFTDVLHALDWNPLDGQTSAEGEDKFYAPGVGLIEDHGVQLVSVTN